MNLLKNFLRVDYPFVIEIIGGKMGKLWLVLIAFLIGITVFSVVKYVGSVQEKYTLINTLGKLQSELTALETAKLNLAHSLEKEKDLNEKLVLENTELSDNLKENEEKLTKLDADFRETLKKVEELNAQVTTLKDQNETATLQLSQVTQERDMLKVRLTSIPELKKAIKELKQQIRQTSQEVKTKVQEERIILGNRGFLIKDGKPTYPQKVRIEVEPITR